jgi:type VI secretion system protein ImpJ
VARVAKSPGAEATPELNLSYTPPVLSCDAWPPLLGLVQTVYDRTDKKIELRSNQIVSRGITFDSQAQGDPLLFEQLRELNQV